MRARREAARLERERQARRRERVRRARSLGIAVAVVLVLGGAGFAVFRAGTVDYAAFADRPVVINSFASWCPSCIAEMPDFERVHQEPGDRVVFLGVSQRDARSASIELARRTGITYATGIDGTSFNAIAGQGMPTTVLIGPGGEIASVQVGQLSADDLPELIGSRLGVRA